MIKPRIYLLDTTPFSQVFSNLLSQGDELDFDNFDLLSNSQFQLKLGETTAEVNVFLLNSLGQVINFSVNEGNEEESLAQSLDSGTYSILVRPNRNLSISTDYNVAVSPTYIVEPKVVLPGSEFDFLSSQAIWQTNGVVKDQEILQVASIEPKTGFLVLDNPQAINNSLSSSGKIGNNSTWGYGNSNIDKYSSDDTPETAKKIGLLDATPFSQSFSDSVSQQDQLDFYNFDLLSNSQLQLKLSGMTADANVFLLNSLGQTINFSVNKENKNESLTQSLDPGTYYILVRSNRNLSISTNYNLTVSATYIVDDVLVSNPEVPLPDPEFDSLSSQAVWQAGGGINDNGILQLAPIDPETGFLLLDNMKALDNGLPSLGKTENGPEWAYGNSLKIVYNKTVNGKIVFNKAEWTGTTWKKGSIIDSQGNPLEGISPLTHLDKNFGLLSYLKDIKVGNTTVRLSAWADLDNQGIGGILPGERRRWVEGERSILLTQEVAGYEQLFKFNIDTNSLEQLTFDATDKVGDAFMFRAPEFNNELIFFVAETTIDNNFRPNQHSVYRKVNGQWTKIQTIVSPVPELPIITGHEPFTINGHSYIAFNISKGGPKGERVLDGSQQVWFSGVGPNEEDGLVKLRRVSSDNGTINSNKIPDPEAYVTQAQDKAFIYYSTTEVVGGVSTIHRADTGLGTNSVLGSEIQPNIPVVDNFNLIG